MLWKWRFEQFQSVLAPAFYITTLALLLYPYIGWRLPDGVKGGFALIWLGLLFLIMVAAWVWDDLGQMWKASQRVNVKRNQYAQGTLFPKERIFIELIWLPIMEKEGLDTSRVRRWLDDEEGAP